MGIVPNLISFSWVDKVTYFIPGNHNLHHVTPYVSHLPSFLLMLKGIVQYFGAYFLSLQELYERIDTTVISVKHIRRQ